MTLIENFYKNERFKDISEIVQEERVLKEFKSLYIKHAFDALSEIFKNYYEIQFEYIKKIKKQYKDRYGA